MKMDNDSGKLLSKARDELAKRFLSRKPRPAADEVGAETFALRPATGNWDKIPDAYTRFDAFPGYENIKLSRTAAKHLHLGDPFFRTHEGIAGATTQISGKTYINFSSYNYLGLSGDPRVAEAAKAAIDRYGISASASRLVAGERPVQRELETELAKVYDAEDCVVFVSGHATNVSTIGYLFGPKDLIVHDALAHNSIFEGIKLSGATRRSFPHNDAQALDAILAEIRGQFERVLIVVEGLYSMDGDIADLPALIDIKTRHKAFLMVDEAHALGVLGKTGKGLHEHFGIDGNAVDIWMGTLSKTLSSCGGYIAGPHALIDHLKYAAPGFVYSVGIAPVLAAASLQALRIMNSEPERVQQLQENGRRFKALAQAAGLNVGLSAGYAIVPIITGSSIKAVKLSNQLFDAGINVQPIVHPAVEERAARLRFFIGCQHTEEQFSRSVNSIQSAN